MKPNPSPVDRFVRARHRLDQTVPPLAVIATGLAVTLALIWIWHPSLAPVLHWGRLPAGWIAGVAAAWLGAATVWWKRRRNLLGGAARLDEALAANNRLEAATALQQADDPLAQAQRDETGRYLQNASLRLRRWPLPALGTLVVVLALAHAATWLCWSRTLNSAGGKADALEKAKASAVTANASIEWNSPEVEATAAAIEEVPLEAVADSTGGLRDTTLAVEVNGETRLTQPLTADELKQPGRHTIKTSLYLDQFEVKPFDMVSYHIRAQRAESGKLPPTVSPVQFVQVRPLREDVFVCAGGDKPSRCFNYVTALKTAQLRLMKENFTLAHAGLNGANEAWKEANVRVGDEQSQLAGRADEVIQLMSTNNYPAEILGLVRESQPLMTEAGGKIQRQENEPALAPQGKALAKLTAVEKYLKQVISLSSAGGRPKANDQFNKPKNLELKQHPLTPAGKIDALAKQQSGLAGELAQTGSATNIIMPGPDGKDENALAGTATERQAEIKRRIGEFMDSNPNLEPEAMAHLQKGESLAGESQNNLEQNDVPAALEPAAAAAHELNQTAGVMRRAGDQAAKNPLADALLKLASAADSVRNSPRAKTDAEARALAEQAAAAVREAAQRLSEAAQSQQERGSGNAAARLAEMAKLLDVESLRRQFDELSQQPRDANRANELASRLEQLAEQAAQQRNPGGLSRSELARLIDRMERTQANLQRLASAASCNSPGNGQTGGQGAGQNPGQGQSGAAPSTAGGVKRGGSGTAPGNPTGHLQGESLKYGPVPGASPAQSGIGGAPATTERSEEQRQQLALELLDDVREGTLDAMSAVPKSSELAKMRETLNRVSHSGGSSGNVVALASEINPPLSGLIKLLQVELAQHHRQHQLTDPQIEQAPPAYRPAVADYFEQLSRDYQTNGPVREVSSQ